MTPNPGPADPPPNPAVSGRKRPDLSDLGPRILSGLILVALAIGTAVAGGAAFVLLWWLAALAIHWEWQRLLGPTRYRIRLVVGGIAITAAALSASNAHPAWSLLILACGTLATTALDRRILSGAGVAYAGVLPLAVGLIRASESFGLEAVFWLFAVVWGTDVMAYFGGRLVGGPKLWPRVSPSKTWSGFLIGIASGSLAGLAVATHWSAHWVLIPLGLVAGTLAQAGDLFESALKRRFGVKDSSRLIPGHGGVMDRLDGFLAASVFGAVFGTLRFGMDASAAGLMSW